MGDPVPTGPAPRSDDALLASPSRALALAQAEVELEMKIRKRKRSRSYTVAEADRAAAGIAAMERDLAYLREQRAQAERQPTDA